MAEAGTQTGNDVHKKLQDLSKQRSKKFISNLILVVAVLTAIGVGLSFAGMNAVFAFLAIGFLPAIAANISDGRPGRFASKTVMAFNFSGISPHMAAILSSGSPNSTAFAISSDPLAWLLIYGFAAFGWGVVYLIPHITQLYLEVKANYTIQRLQSFQQTLVDEWSERIKK